MGTVVFDFDSTLFAEESLDVLLREPLAGRPDLIERVKRITEAGMAGEIPFERSLRERLALAAPARADAEALGARAARELAPEMRALIAELHARAGVWIVSGAFVEALLPIARELGIPHERALGVRANWNPDGSFGGLDPADGFAVSKVEGVRRLAPPWPAPRVGVGDGMSDYDLFRAGLVDRFVAYTQHARRPAVLATGAPEARNPAELRRLLQAWV